ncbi:CxC2 domain-containing protein [Mycena chlorophos]|uniref:CxC2 domain-containing protein n=1 Tax=Mycena chlorophos TaxID=658473 RepID=A0A8H6WM78_MYCCL|nr:CxC2 domain-containing protein [Mycena chlorophos]
MSSQRGARPLRFRVGRSVVPRTADRATHFRANGSAETRYVNVERAKRPRLEQRDDEDGLSSWTPFADEEGWEDVVDAVDSVTSVPGHHGRRRHAADDPMRMWMPHMSQFLDELLRGEGLGRHFQNPTCALCGVDALEFFRCVQCGPFLECESCARLRHSTLPLHTLQWWDGSSWAKCSLYREPGVVKQLGLEYQLGHHGLKCPLPEGPGRTITVIGVGRIVKVDVRFCGCTEALHHRLGHISQLLHNGWYPATVAQPHTCATFEALDVFRLLKVGCNVNVTDYMNTLARMTSATFRNRVPQRARAMGRMSRQYDFLLLLKRAGRGHVPEGVSLTPPGGLAVRCWACPDPERNLAPGWETQPDQYRFATFLALDANFRLKNRLRRNERPDPSLGSGLLYFVKDEPYKRHLRDYVAEHDVSTCIAFAALMQKETRLTTGLRVSGVGGCVCARHGVVRPQGIGDLQKGERYANMDWVFMSAVGGSNVKRLVISYDIACQWKQRLRERVKKIKAPEIATRLDDYELQFALPVWHAAAHETRCQAEMSLSHAVGVGRTDGEGIERTWAILNPMSWSTKEMGEGNRHDTLDNKVDQINFDKNIGETLARKMIIAIKERDRQVAEFAEVDESVEEPLRKEWQARLDVWHADRSQALPYLLDGKHVGLTEAQILAELKAAELVDLREGRGDVLGVKMTSVAFIKAGLQLEDQQRRIKNEVQETTTLSAERASQLDELRGGFYKKLPVLRAKAEEQREGDEPPPLAEDIRLWLPSRLTASERRAVCTPSLVSTEERLREGQCGDAISKLRGHLHSKTHLVDQRNANAVGQATSTRYGGLIARVDGHVKREAAKYTAAREAGLALNNDFAPKFQQLTDEDLRVYEEAESDAKARAELGRLGSARRARNEPSLKRGLGPVSWIWFVGGDGDQKELHDSVRVQWTKAKARRDRWTEEVAILKEEMRRVLRSIDADVADWEKRLELRTEVDAELAAGLRAYGLRQAAMLRRIGASFRARWSTSAAEGVRSVVNATSDDDEDDEVQPDGDEQMDTEV